MSTHAARQTYPRSPVIDPSSTALRTYLTSCAMVWTTNGNVKSIPHGVSNCICFFESIDVSNVQQSFVEQLQAMKSYSSPYSKVCVLMMGVAGVPFKRANPAPNILGTKHLTEA